MIAKNFHIALEYIDEFLAVRSFVELRDLLGECHPDITSLADKQAFLDVIMRSESLCKDTINLLWLNSVSAKLYFK